MVNNVDDRSPATTSGGVRLDCSAPSGFNQHVRRHCCPDDGVSFSAGAIIPSPNESVHLRCLKCRHYKATFLSYRTVRRVKTSYYAKEAGSLDCFAKTALKSELLKQAIFLPKRKNDGDDTFMLNNVATHEQVV